MFYSIFRNAFWIASFIFIIFAIRKTKYIKKKFIIIAIFFFCIIMGTLLSLLPVENLFITFKTPQDVFNYTCSGKILNTTEGNKSCMVIYKPNNNPFTMTIITKTDSGYKIGTAFNYKVINSEIVDGNYYQIYEVTGTNDFYFCGSVSNTNGDMDISDSINSIFKKEDNDSNSNLVTYTTFIDNLPSDYYAIMNGKKIYINKQ